MSEKVPFHVYLAEHLREEGIDDAILDLIEKVEIPKETLPVILDALMDAIEYSGFNVLRDVEEWSDCDAQKLLLELAVDAWRALKRRISIVENGDVSLVHPTEKK